ncbi:hypothetical protein KXX44_009319 [Aspergillus fumigatus]|nr:hypothetical protein KXX44_009319 [Aspergillus fumigatus]KAH1838770.1 hypothetical protein KXX55_005426 [Aspergillus fumigatus]KAH3034127.1 hypothetical protein KXW01_006469 [Aspergillus fumigatus]
MTDSARREAAKQFVSAKSNYNMLLTSYQCRAHGLNLHGQCSRVVLLEPPLNINTLFQAVGRVHRLGQGVKQKAWILFQEYSISHWIKCNNVIKALPQLAASLHNLLKPLVVAAMGDTADSADDDAQAKLIQTHAKAYLRQMLGQSSSQLGVQALDDLGLPQQDLDWMKAQMTPKGHKQESGRQASPTKARAQQKRTKATASQVEYHPPIPTPRAVGRSQH